jgi:hypothetical protein
MVKPEDMGPSDGKNWRRIYAFVLFILLLQIALYAALTSFYA